MPLTFTWLGHGTWQIQCGEHKLLLDPFLDDNPAAPVKAADVEADYILISHGHFDHIADAPSIAQRTGAQVIANFEIAQWLTKNHGIENVLAMNLGGGVELPCGRVKMTLAHHSSSLPDGSYGGTPAGFLLSAQGKKVYFACDTAIFTDMKWLSDEVLDLAVLPIGDLYTMGPADSIRATRLIGPKRVAPAHYNTWPPIEQDVEDWAVHIRGQTNAQPLIVPPGGTIEL